MHKLPFLIRQVIRHAAKYPEHGRASAWITGPDKGHGSGMAEYLPITLGTLDRGCGCGTLEWLSRDQTAIGQVERHGNELSEFTHGLASGIS